MNDTIRWKELETLVRKITSPSVIAAPKIKDRYELDHPMYDSEPGERTWYEIDTVRTDGKDLTVEASVCPTDGVEAYYEPADWDRPHDGGCVMVDDETEDDYGGMLRIRSNEKRLNVRDVPEDTVMVIFDILHAAKNRKARNRPTTKRAQETLDWLNSLPDETTLWWEPWGKPSLKRIT